MATEAVQPVQVNREEFLATLEAVRPGLATPDDSVEQGTCFVFGNGWVRTYNERVACRARTGLPEGVVGAVDHTAFLNLLRKLPDETVRVTATETEVVVLGKRSRSKFNLEAAVAQPSVEKPEKWESLSADFGDAILLTADCCGKDKNDPSTYCLHVHPDRVESTDLMQLARYTVRTPVSSLTLLWHPSLLGMATQDYTESADTKAWLHFRNPKGVVYSCRKVQFKDEVQDFGPIIEASGEKLVLPATLGEVAARCEVFSQDNAQLNVLEVSVRKDKIVLKGVGAMGQHEERRTADYSGPDLDFLATPKVLIELVKRQTACEVYTTKDGWPRLKASGDHWVYVVLMRRQGDNG